MTYTYLILTGPEIDKTLEVEQSIKDEALTEVEHNGEVVQVKRLISAGTGFILKGDCWARTNYERGIQSYDPKNRDKNGPK